MPFDPVSYALGTKTSGGGGSTVTVEPLTVTENGTYTAPDNEAYTPVTVNVPNSYSASDEGKVVDGGELVAQTSLAVTQNGTVDTTLNNSVVVNVPTGGGGGVASNDVNFIDYDGTIVYSYSAADFAQLSALPANPSHSGLTAQGWNWTLADAKAYVASYGLLDIGQMYVTDDGKTRIYVHFEEGRTSPYLGLAVNGTVDIDWGDGSEHGTLTGTSTSTIKTVQHTYATGGDYVIKLTPANGTSFAIKGSSSTWSRLLNKTENGTSNASRVYCSSIKKIEFGNGVLLADYSFYNCNSLESITVPQNTSYNNSNLFANCVAIKCIIIPIGTTRFSSSLIAGGSSIQYIALPKSVEYIQGSCASNCYGLGRICIPNSTKSFGSNAFNGCGSLATITIPSSVTSIDANAFNSCYGLRFIKFESTTPPTVSSSNAFANLLTDCIIYVPFASLASYLSVTNYPSSATYTYLGFATYASGATLPTQDTTSAYNVTWYATKEDAKAGTNPITQGNGSEVYCTYAAV